MDIKVIKVIEAANLSPLETREDGFGVTVAEFAREKHCTINQARETFDKAVEAGILMKKMMRDGKHSCAVYYIPK